MKVIYVAATGIFYPERTFGPHTPAGFELTEEEFEVFKQAKADGKRVVPGDDGQPTIYEPGQTVEELRAAGTAAIQEEMDRQARERGYDNILSACSYAGQVPGAPFQAEGAAFLAWRSQVWQTAFAVLAEVAAGTRDMPTPEQAVAAMPALVLP